MTENFSNQYQDRHRRERKQAKDKDDTKKKRKTHVVKGAITKGLKKQWKNEDYREKINITCSLSNVKVKE